VKPAAVFDQLARSYDREFGGTLGRLYRRAVWRWLDRAFRPGEHVLELSCGTGEDAVHLAAGGVRVLATDPSAGMLAVAREKVPADAAVDLRELSIEELDRLVEERPEPFQGGFCNFGGLNFVENLQAASANLGRLLGPHAPLILCVVGRWVPWEWIWFLGHGHPGRAFRRVPRGGALWKGVRVWYHTPRQVARAFAGEFRVIRTAGLGVLVPPPYAEQWAHRHGRLVALLDRWERRAEEWPLMDMLGDHFLMELRRR
jgi:SAM-dependent methyltransferase